MGMTVVGTPDNIRLFNYITSSSISPIEGSIMNSVTGGVYQSYSLDEDCDSVLMDLINDYLVNSTSVEAFIENGYIIETSTNDKDFIVIDPETGIVRDINVVNNIYGAIVPYDKCLKDIFYSDLNGVGTKLFAWQIASPWDHGAWSFYWDGNGEVYVGSNPNVDPSDDEIFSYCKLIITGPLDSITFNPGDSPYCIGGDIDITKILIPKTINVIDVTSTTSNTGTWDFIGCSSLAINEVSLNNTEYQGINATEAYNFAEILKQHPNALSTLEDGDSYKNFYNQYLNNPQDIAMGNAVGNTISGDFLDFAVNGIEFCSENPGSDIVVIVTFASIIGALLT